MGTRQVHHRDVREAPLRQHPGIDTEVPGALPAGELERLLSLRHRWLQRVSTLEQHRLLDLLEDVLTVAAPRAVRSQPDYRAGGSQIAQAENPRRKILVGDGIVGDTCAGLPEDP